MLWLRAAETSVQVFHAHELVASHTRATRPGQRRTHPDHLPPAKVATLQATPAYCLRRAREIGPHTTALVEQLFGERPVDRLRSVQATLRWHGYSSANRRSFSSTSRRIIRGNGLSARTRRRLSIARL